MFLGCTPKPSPVYTAGLGLTPPYGPEPGSMNAVTQPVYFAKVALLDRGACRMAEESDRHGWKPSLPVAEGAAGNPSCRTFGRILYFRYSSQG